MTDYELMNVTQLKSLLRQKGLVPTGTGKGKGVLKKDMIKALRDNSNYDMMSLTTLKSLVKEKGLVPTGTGSHGRILKKDLVNSLKTSCTKTTPTTKNTQKSKNIQKINTNRSRSIIKQITDNCPVCLEEDNIEKLFKLRPCNHYIHPKCCVGLRTKNCCVCRTPVLNYPQSIIREIEKHEEEDRIERRNEERRPPPEFVVARLFNLFIGQNSQIQREMRRGPIPNFEIVVLEDGTYIQVRD